MLNRSENTLRSLLAGALALTTVSAHAADIYGPSGLKDAPAYLPVNTWSGFYAGVNGGYGWSANDPILSTSTNWLYADELGRQTGTFASNIGKLRSEGGFGGGQIGYNAQRGSFVFGIEIDAQAASINGKVNTSIDASSLVSGLTINAGAKSELDWFGTLRARLGYATGAALFYVTGGFAVGGVKDTLALSSNPDYGSFTFANCETRAGYVIGGGLEYLFSPSWSLKAEYQYMDFGSSSINGTVFSANETYVAGGALTTSKIDHTYNTARIGLNYHLNQVYEPLK